MHDARIRLMQAMKTHAGTKWGFFMKWESVLPIYGLIEFGKYMPPDVIFVTCVVYSGVFTITHLLDWLIG
jgi:hypothetical protein